MMRLEVRELSEIFDVVQSTNMPWYSEPARIDPDTYLPIVNGVGLEELSSGGEDDDERCLPPRHAHVRAGPSIVSRTIELSTPVSPLRTSRRHLRSDT